MRGNPEFGHDQKKNITRIKEILELSRYSYSPPKCEICGKPYLPVPDPVKPLPFPVKPEELGWEVEIKRGDQVVRVAKYHLKCDLEGFDEGDFKKRLREQFREILRKMGFNVEEVEWLR